MNLVIDASVACKWFFEENLSSEARALAESEATFSAPDTILVECANAVWRRVAGKTVPEAQARAFLNALPQWFESRVRRLTPQMAQSNSKRERRPGAALIDFPPTAE